MSTRPLPRDLELAVRPRCRLVQNFGDRDILAGHGGIRSGQHRGHELADLLGLGALPLGPTPLPGAEDDSADQRERHQRGRGHRADVSPDEFSQTIAGRIALGADR